MSEAQEPMSMHDAGKFCSMEHAGHVCSMGDYADFCEGAYNGGFDPFADQVAKGSNGWYGDTTLSDDKYKTINSQTCEHRNGFNNDGAAVHSSRHRTFRCCSSPALMNTDETPPEMQAASIVSASQSSTGWSGSASRMLIWAARGQREVWARCCLTKRGCECG